MIRLLRGEIFKEIKLHEKLKLNYAISNYGRLVSYKENLLSGNELNGGKVEGYKILRYSILENGKRKYYFKFFSRLVAENFLQKKSDDQNVILHLDFDKLNDKVENLRWATKVEQTFHHSKNPKVIANKQRIIEHNIKADGRKLTSTQVIRIKKMLQRDNNTRLVIIAKQFNISTQQLYRIRTGENWGHILV